MATGNIGSVQAKLQEETIAFQKIETGVSDFVRTPKSLAADVCQELAGVIEARQRLDSQLSENESVLKVGHEGHLWLCFMADTCLMIGILPLEIPQYGIQARRPLARPTRSRGGKDKRRETVRVHQE